VAVIAAVFAAAFWRGVLIICGALMYIEPALDIVPWFTMLDVALKNKLKLGTSDVR
jgi:hypothetical protein